MTPKPDRTPSAASSRKQPPLPGDRWRSRDRRDDGLVVRVMSVASEPVDEQR